MRRRSLALAAAAATALLLLLPPLLVAACQRRGASLADTDGAPPARGDCEALRAESDRRITAVVADHLACTRNDQCTAVSRRTKCVSAGGLVVSTSGVAAVEAARAVADDGLCADFERGGCPRPAASSYEPTAGCVGGRCQDVFRWPSR